MTRPVGLGVLVPSILVAIAAGVLVSMATAAGPDSGSAILALLPFDGPADPLAEPGRVVMLLADGDRLRRLAESGSARGPARVWLVDADHHVTREGPDHAVVESRYEIEVEGQGSAGWSVPVGSARDLSATVDDRPTPLAIAPDGTAATLAIEGPGVHSLRLRRSVPLRTEGAGAGPGRFRLPINRAAFARVEVSGETRGFRVEVPVAAGQVEAIPEGMGGAIGPVEALEVRWSAMDRTAARDLAGPVEAKMLWDARPVGDLLRIRLTHSDPEGASTIRLAPEPGLVVRSFSIPDVVAISREGPPGRPEWVAHVDPPWPRDIPIEVVLWRPHSPDQGPRRLPRVELPGSRRLSGSVGLRRPGDWSGRLEPVDGAEPLPESSFARSWGPLPSDGLTLAGSVRFGRLPELGVAIGPLPLRRTVRPRVQVEFEPGRLNTSIDAVLSDQQGRSFAIEMGMPTDFRVVRVEAGGMLDWQKVARDRLRIQFDGSEARDRPIRVQGYLPAPSDPALAETRTYRAPIPWPRWSEAVAEAGTLVVSGPGRFQLDLGEGIAPLSPAGPVEVGASSRSYRVDRPGGLGPVQWSSPRARVGVSVRSDLTIDPGHVTWTAVIDCDVTGGPSEALQWNLPTEWAQTAQLEVAGLPRLPEAETRGRITSWKVALDPPIWGRTRLVIRSRLPVRPGVAFDFPEVAPMALPGRGSVGRYDLAMANVSGRPIEVGGSPGLQAIDASRYRSDESPAPPGSIDRAYRVTGDRWSLRVTVGGADDRTRGHPGGESTRLARARLRGTIGPTGETWGLASYDLGPRPGPFLALRLPEGVDVPWASVDGSVTPGLRDGPGRWMIPLRDREARRVELCWHAPPRRGVPEGPLTVAWPITDPPELPTLFRLFAPRSIDVASLPGGLERIDRREWEVEEAEQLARRIGDALSNFDRGSRRRRVEIIRDVVAFELGDRALRRTPVPPSAGTEADGARLRSARDSITEAGQGAGLEDLIQDARSRVGLGPGLGEPEAEGRIGPVEPTRIRRIGVAHHFRGEGPGSGRARRITWAPRPLTPWWQARSAWLIASLGLMIASALGWLVARPIPVSRRSAGAALSAVALVLLALEPQGTALVLAVVALGRSIE